MRAAPIVLMAALLYDEAARAAALDLLRVHRPKLSTLWRRAAIDGVHDPELRDLACELWRIGLTGARRLPADYIGEPDLAATESFLEHFTGRGRMPTDELLELLAEDPARALEWASS
jgi:hypothetical protein